jgi:putative FmdB family regulatory protein
MPTYAYRCPACGHEFEKFQKITANRRPRCPSCGTAVERVITGGAGLHFKGSGFYITDYKKSPSSETAQEGKKEQEGQQGQKSEKPAPKKTGNDH